MRRETFLLTRYYRKHDRFPPNLHHRLMQCVEMDYGLEGRSHVSKIVGVHLSFQTPQTSNYSGQRRMGEEWEGCPPPRPTRESGGRRQLSQRGLERSRSRKRFWGVSCAILCDFTHLLLHLTAAWKRQISTPLYWLVGLIFPFNFLGLSDTPNLNFLGCPDTHDTQWQRHWNGVRNVPDDWIRIRKTPPVHAE